jgi:HD-like signal output (HDOD) protein
MKNLTKLMGKNEDTLFKGLSERQLKTLYSLAPIKRLEADQVLIREGDTDQTVYVVLEGEIRIVKSHNGYNELIGTLGRGNWVGEISLTKQIPRTASAIANLPSSIMAIDRAILGALDENAQLFFYKQLNELTSERIGKLQVRERELTNRNSLLMDHLYSAHTQSQPDYSNSEMIRSIIEKIPRLPVFADTLATKLFEEQTSVKEIAGLVKQDPSLLGMVMKRINSAYYGFRSKISDIHHALVLIGFNGLYQLVMAEGVRRTMPDKPFYQDLQAHSVAISNISYALSQASKIGKPSEIATIGLLHELGKVIIELLKDQNPSLNFILETMDPAQMVSILLKKWNLPEVVWKSVAFQRYPEFSLPSKVPREILPNVALLCMAHICYLIFEGLTEEELPPAFIEEYKDVLKWRRFSLSHIAREVILPGLIKKQNTFPSSFRELIAKAAGAEDPKKIHEIKSLDLPL